MKKINPNNPNELSLAIGKQCNVTFDVIGFPNQVYQGVLTNIQFNTTTGELRIIINIENAGIIIPVKSISLLEVEE
jgi:hypothetical protein